MDTSRSEQTFLNELIERMNRSCVMLIIRGCSGSGKSQLGRHLQNVLLAEVIEADTGLDDTVVDYQIASWMDMTPFVLRALTNSYEIVVTEPFTAWKNDELELAKRSNRPIEEIRSQIARFEFCSDERVLVAKAVWQCMMVKNSCDQQSRRIDSLSSRSTTDEGNDSIEKSDSEQNASSNEIDVFKPDNVFELKLEADIVAKLVKKFELPSFCRKPTANESVTLKLDIDDAARLHGWMTDQLRIPTKFGPKKNSAGLTYSEASRLGNLINEFAGKVNPQTVEASFRQNGCNEIKTRILMQRQVQIHGKTKTNEDSRFIEEGDQLPEPDGLFVEEQIAFHDEMRTMFLNKAEEAYANRRGAVAAYYSSKARDHGFISQSKKSEKDTETIAKFVEEMDKTDCVDLHNCTQSLANRVLKAVLADRKTKLYLIPGISNKVHVITGHGKHSANKVGVIRGDTIRYLQKERFTYAEKTIGKFTIRFPKAKVYNGLV